MKRTVNIEVYANDDGDGEVNVFGVISEHRAELPKPFNQALQEWVADNFSGMRIVEAIEDAGEMLYEPNGDVVGFRRKEEEEE